MTDKGSGKLYMWRFSFVDVTEGEISSVMLFLQSNVGQKNDYFINLEIAKEVFDLTQIKFLKVHSFQNAICRYLVTNPRTGQIKILT